MLDSGVTEGGKNAASFHVLESNGHNKIVKPKAKKDLFSKLSKMRCRECLVEKSEGTNRPFAGTRLKACLHGGGGPQVGEVTRLGGVTRLSI